ncbi:MAG: GlxA family transcriptional regulator [Robiginitomaculum sp.]|nr:GlxA family transcriptional regulator [Robiginitomaculum sp.]
MSKTCQISFLIYDGFELLDLAGPSSVFSATNTVLGRTAYEVQTMSAQGGQVHCNSGIIVGSYSLTQNSPCVSQMVLVVGGNSAALTAAMADQVIQQWLIKFDGKAERYGSICSGAFVLAAAGLLDNRKVTTHWAGCLRLAKMFPQVLVNPDAIYMVDGSLWTSAGVTSGVDMALAMVAKDHGNKVMGEVAKWLVVYAHRPGNQSQFSSILAAQTTSNGIFFDLTYWLQTRVDIPTNTEEMAKYANMSERTFRRKFTANIGISPAKFFEQLRLEKARELLEDNIAVSKVSRLVGYCSESGFRNAFFNKFGLSPSMHATIHSKAGH